MISSNADLMGKGRNSSKQAALLKVVVQKKNTLIYPELTLPHLCTKNLNKLSDQIFPLHTQERSMQCRNRIYLKACSTKITKDWSTRFIFACKANVMSYLRILIIKSCIHHLYPRSTIVAQSMFGILYWIDN